MIMTRITLEFKNTCDCGCGNTVIELRSKQDIIFLLDSGYPICPECGRDMEWVK